jgi:hypothetical protein
VIEISIDYTRLFMIIQVYDYIRLFANIPGSITKTQTIIRDNPKRRLFHLLYYDYFTFFSACIIFFRHALLFSACIIAIIAIIHGCVHYFYRKLYYAYYYILDEFLRLFCSERIMCIIRIISSLLCELFFRLTIITIIFFQCYYTHTNCFPNTLSSLYQLWR